MDNNFYEKYIKYKTKYNKLKNLEQNTILSGGSPDKDLIKESFKSIQEYIEHIELINRHNSEGILDSFKEPIILTHWILDGYILLNLDKGNTRNGTISQLKNILKNPKINNLFEIIYSQETLKKYVKLLDDTEEYYNIMNYEFEKKLDLFRYEKDLDSVKDKLLNILNDINEKITNIVNTNDEKYFFIQSSTHAMGAYYKKLDENRYKFYYINSGEGSEYQNLKSTDVNSGIIGYVITKNKLIRFLKYEFLLNSMRVKTENFYCILLKDLLDDSYEQTSDKFMEEYHNLLATINTPMQIKGDCSFRSVMFLLEIITRQDLNSEYPTLNLELSDRYQLFLNLSKFYLIQNFFEFVLSREEPDTINYYYDKIQIYIEYYTFLESKIPYLEDLIIKNNIPIDINLIHNESLDIVKKIQLIIIEIQKNNNLKFRLIKENTDSSKLLFKPITKYEHENPISLLNYYEKHMEIYKQFEEKCKIIKSLSSNFVQNFTIIIDTLEKITNDIEEIMKDSNNILSYMMIDQIQELIMNIVENITIYKENFSIKISNKLFNDIRNIYFNILNTIKNFYCKKKDDILINDYKKIIFLNLTIILGFIIEKSNNSNIELCNDYQKFKVWISTFIIKNYYELQFILKFCELVKTFNLYKYLIVPNINPNLIINFKNNIWGEPDKSFQNLNGNVSNYIFDQKYIKQENNSINILFNYSNQGLYAIPNIFPDINISKSHDFISYDLNYFFNLFNNPKLDYDRSLQENINKYFNHYIKKDKNVDDDKILYLILNIKNNFSTIQFNVNNQAEGDLLNIFKSSLSNITQYFYNPYYFYRDFNNFWDIIININKYIYAESDIYYFNHLILGLLEIGQYTKIQDFNYSQHEFNVNLNNDLQIINLIKKYIDKTFEELELNILPKKLYFNYEIILITFINLLLVFINDNKDIEYNRLIFDLILMIFKINNYFSNNLIDLLILVAIEKLTLQFNELVIPDEINLKYSDDYLTKSIVLIDKISKLNQYYNYTLDFNLPTNLQNDYNYDFVNALRKIYFYNSFVDTLFRSNRISQIIKNTPLCSYFKVNTFLVKNLSSSIFNEFCILDEFIKNIYQFLNAEYYIFINDEIAKRDDGTVKNLSNFVYKHYFKLKYSNYSTNIYINFNEVNYPFKLFNNNFFLESINVNGDPKFINDYKNLENKIVNDFNLKIIFDSYFFNAKNYFKLNQNIYQSDDLTTLIQIDEDNYNLIYKLDSVPYLVMKMTDIVKDNSLINIYINIFLFLNSNFNDRPSNIKTDDDKKTIQYKTYLSNELIVLIKDSSTYLFYCPNINIIFTHTKNTNVITYGDYVIDFDFKELFYNRFVTNTNLLLGFNTKYLKYYIIGTYIKNNSDKYNYTGVYEIECTYNDVFNESDNLILGYFCKEQLNAGNIKIAYMIISNIYNNNKNLNKNIQRIFTLNLLKFNKSNSIFYYLFGINLYNTNLFNITKNDYYKLDDAIDSNLQKSIDDKQNLFTQQHIDFYEFFNYVNFDLNNFTKSIYKICLAKKSKISSNIADYVNINDAILYLGFKKDGNQKLSYKVEDSYYAVNCNRSVEFTNTIVFNKINKYNFSDSFYIEADLWNFNDPKSELLKYFDDIQTKTFTPKNNIDPKLIYDYFDFINDLNTQNYYILNKNKINLLLKAVKKHILALQQNYCNMYINKIKHDYFFTLDMFVFNLQDKYLQNTIIVKYLVLKKLLVINEQIESMLSYDSDNYDCTSIYNLINLTPSYIGYSNAKSNAFVYFEYLFGSIVRQGQVDFVYNLLKELTTDTPKNFHQLLMGEGKTSVIAPLTTMLLLQYGQPNYTIYHVMPDSLVPQSNRIMNNIFGHLNPQILDTRIKIISDYNIKINKLTNFNDDQFNNNMKKSYILFDEIDEITDPLKSQLNIQGIDDNYENIQYSNVIFEFIFFFIYNLYFSDTPNYISNEYSPQFIKAKKELLTESFKNQPHFILDSNTLSDKSIKIINDLYLLSIKTVFGNLYVQSFNLLKQNNIQELSKYLGEKSVVKIQILNMLLNFDKIIPTILKQLHRRHFGLRYNQDSVSIIYSPYNHDKILDDDDIKKYFVAVPFVADEKPSDNSEFTDYLYTVALTIISYFDKPIIRIRNIDLQLYLEYLYQQYEIHKFKKISSNPAVKLYTELTKNITNSPQIIEFKKIIFFNNHQINTIKNNFPLQFYVKNIVLPKFIKIIKFVNSLSFTDILSSNFCQSRIGFTGTPFIYLPKEIDPSKEIHSIIKQTKGDGAIVASIVGIEADNKIIIQDNNDKIITYALTNNYHVIIDTGSFFINNDSTFVAENIIRKIKELNLQNKFKCVVFVDKNNNKTSIDLEFNYKNYEALTVPLFNRFYYYDQGHITGIDMKIYPLAKGLITISSFNRFRDVAQGIYRMRNINKGQTVDFIINNNLNNFLQNNIVKLINYLIANESTYNLNQKPLFNKQNIQTIYRNYFENINVYSINVNAQTSNDEFVYLQTNIYRQPLYIDVNNIDDINMTLLSFSKLEFDFVLKFITDPDYSKLIHIIMSNTNFNAIELQSNQFESTQQQQKQQQQQQQQQQQNLEFGTYSLQSEINKVFQYYTTNVINPNINILDYENIEWGKLNLDGFCSDIWTNLYSNAHNSGYYISNDILSYSYQTKNDFPLQDMILKQIQKRENNNSITINNILFRFKNSCFDTIYYNVYGGNINFINEDLFRYYIGWIEVYYLKDNIYFFSHIILIKRVELYQLILQQVMGIGIKIKLIGNGLFFTNMNPKYNVIYKSDFNKTLLFLKFYLRDKTLNQVEITSLIPEFHKLRLYTNSVNPAKSYCSFDIDKILYPRLYFNTEIEDILLSKWKVQFKPYFHNYLFKNYISHIDTNNFISIYALLKYVSENYTNIINKIIFKQKNSYNFIPLIYEFNNKIQLCTGDKMKSFAQFIDDIVQNTYSIKEFDYYLNKITLKDYIGIDHPDEFDIQIFANNKTSIQQAWNIIIESNLISELKPTDENIC